MIKARGLSDGSKVKSIMGGWALAAAAGPGLVIPSGEALDVVEARIAPKVAALNAVRSRGSPMKAKNACA
jgi:hypothetical protein